VLLKSTILGMVHFSLNAGLDPVVFNFAVVYPTLRKYSWQQHCNIKQDNATSATQILYTTDHK
jgi:hypothetical protein